MSAASSSGSAHGPWMSASAGSSSGSAHGPWMGASAAASASGSGLKICAFYKPKSRLDTAYTSHFLGNFYMNPLSVHFDGQTNHFQCAEAAFQATKEWHNARAYANLDGDGAYKTSRARPIPSGQRIVHVGGRDNWSSMFVVLCAKFQDPVLAQQLQQTNDAFLLEHRPQKTSTDVYWSDGYNGSGQNWLGLQLMIIRSALAQGADLRALSQTTPDRNAHQMAIASQYGYPSWGALVRAASTQMHMDFPGWITA